MEGQPANSVYLLCAGRVKLSTCSEEGKAVILRIAVPGEILGLPANISGKPHEATAQVLDDCRVGIVDRQEFITFIETYPAAAHNALWQLSNKYLHAHEQVCALGLSSSAGDKLIRLLLQWCDGAASGGPVRIAAIHTHGEMAEMIGTSRETVTRLIKDLKTRGLIELSRIELCIPDRGKLKAAIGTHHRNGNGNGSM
jgi:CRP/FNR family transcriptional regulator